MPHQTSKVIEIHEENDGAATRRKLETTFAYLRCVGLFSKQNWLIMTDMHHIYVKADSGCQMTATFLSLDECDRQKTHQHPD